MHFAFFAFLRTFRINKLRVFNGSEGFNSPLQHQHFIKFVTHPRRRVAPSSARNRGRRLSPVMKKLFFSVLFISVAAVSLVLLTAPPDKPALVFSNVTLIDGTGAPPKAHMRVIIANEHITALGPASNVLVPRGAREVDGAGKFMIPGLWDMHVHVATSQFNDSQVKAKPEWRREIFFPLLVANGIVGIRDMGGDLDELLALRSEIEAGSLVGPQMIFAGPWLINDSFSAPESLPVMSAKQGRDAVQQLKRRGVDFIKILNLSPEAYFAVAEESKKQGLSFVGHVPREITAAQASDAGQKSIEHVFYSNLAFDCSSRQKDLLQKLGEAIREKDAAGYNKAYDAAIASYDPVKAALLWIKLIKNGTWETPTLINYYANAHRDEALPDDPHLQYFPASLRKDWDPKKLNQGVTPESFAWRKRQADNDLKLVAGMHRAGVSMMAGSDSLDAFVFVGSSLHQELALLVRAGFTPMEALQSATLRPAEFLGRADSQGTVESGKIADMVLLNANPLDDIANLEKIDGVVLRGRYFPHTQLQKMLSDAAAAAARN